MAWILYMMSVSWIVLLTACFPRVAIAIVLVGWLLLAFTS